MVLTALALGLIYGYISVKGQFCMNSGFSNVFRKKDTTKLRSFVSAILIQAMVLPLLFVGIYQADSTSILSNVGFPPLYLIGSIVGGYLFGILMYYTAGCGAGIFYKIGERNSGAVLAAIGFITGVYLTEKGIMKFIREISHETVLINQQPIWKMESPLLMAGGVSVVSILLLFWLHRRTDNKPAGAVWGWKKTGIAIGVIGIVTWIVALLVKSPFGMAIIPGAIDIVDLRLTWALLFVLGLPLGAFASSWKNKKKKFDWPPLSIVPKRLLGGLGLGISGSVAAGCTVGHGLTFVPLLGFGSLVAIFFIFLGSGTIGYLTRK